MAFIGRRVPNCRCTNCGRLVDGATSIDSEAAPEIGSITVCIYCGHIMVYDLNVLSLLLHLRNPTPQEQIDIAGDPRILAIQRARLEIFQPPPESKA